MGSRGSLGGRLKASGSGGSTASAKVGKMSLTRFTHSNCIVLSGVPASDGTNHHHDLREIGGGEKMERLANIAVDCPPFRDRYDHRAEIVVLQYNVRYASCGIRARFAHRDTDIAALSAGPSFIPSPVMAATLPLRCNA